MDISALTEEKIAQMIDYGPALAAPYTERDVRQPVQRL